MTQLARYKTTIFFKHTGYPNVDLVMGLLFMIYKALINYLLTINKAIAITYKPLINGAFLKSGAGISHDSSYGEIKNTLNPVFS